MTRREESVISPRNLSLVTGKIELPITELEETDRSRFGDGNSKSCFGHDNFDALIWHLNGDTEHVVEDRILQSSIQSSISRVQNVYGDTHFGVISI